MSQAFAKILGGDKVESYSAGSKPSGIVNPKVRNQGEGGREEGQEAKAFGSRQSICLYIIHLLSLNIHKSSNNTQSIFFCFQAIAAMREIGYDLSAHDSKSLEEVKGFAPFDAVVTMGCGDACPWMPAKRFVNWTITDPKVRGGKRREGGREGRGKAG